MLDVVTVLDRYNIDTKSALKAVQDVRTAVDASNDPLAHAIKIINDVTGLESLYQDAKLALHVAQGVVERALKQGDKFDPSAAIKDAEDSANKLRANAAMAWLFSAGAEGSAPVVNPDEKTKEIAGKKVVVKKDGKIKKGGKQEAAYALYLEHVVLGKITKNQDFIKLLMKELDMGKPGATTYSYNCKKQHEGASKS